MQIAEVSPRLACGAELVELVQGAGGGPGGSPPPGGGVGGGPGGTAGSPAGAGPGAIGSVGCGSRAGGVVGAGTDGPTDPRGSTCSRRPVQRKWCVPDNFRRRLEVESTVTLSRVVPQLSVRLRTALPTFGVTTTSRFTRHVTTSASRPRRPAGPHENERWSTRAEAPLTSGGNSRCTAATFALT
jgi:hypothetical protein